MEIKNEQEENNIEHFGIVYVIQKTLGTKISTISSILLFMLLEATLVAQLSRAGNIYSSYIQQSSALNFDIFESSSSSFLNLFNYRIGCIIATIIGTLVTFTFGKNFASNINAILTSLFIISITFLYQSSKHLILWSRCNFNNIILQPINSLSTITSIITVPTITTVPTLDPGEHTLPSELSTQVYLDNYEQVNEIDFAI